MFNYGSIPYLVGKIYFKDIVCSFSFLVQRKRTKRKGTFCKGFTSDHEIFALNAMSRKKARRNSKKYFITTVQKDNYDNIILVNYLFHLPTTNNIEP